MKGHIILFVFCFCAISSTLFSQRRHYIKINNFRQTLTFDVGGHHFVGNPAWGGSIGVSIENKLSKHFSLILSLKDYFNGSNFYILDNGNKPVSRLREHRFMLQPSLSFYPLSIFRGFYGSIGGGGVLHTNSADDYDAVEYINGVPQLIPTLELITNLKAGFQILDFQGFVLNIYGGGGLFIPRKLKPLQTYFELGLKMGIKK